MSQIFIDVITDYLLAIDGDYTLPLIQYRILDAKHGYMRKEMSRYR